MIDPMLLSLEGHEFFLCLLFALLGLFWAYLKWSHYAGRYSAALSRQEQLKADIQALKQDKVGVSDNSKKSKNKSSASAKPESSKSKTKDNTDKAAKPSNSGSSASNSAAFKKLAEKDFAGEEVEVDDTLGVLYKNRPDQVDDLTEIKGVASVMEKKLHDSGIYRFKQIANWSPAQIDSFAEKLKGFKSRMHTEDWVGQAKSLAKNS